MQYIAGIVSGVAGSALFWLLDKFILTLPQESQMFWMIVVFIAFGISGYVFIPKSAPLSVKETSSSILSRLKGESIDAKAEKVKVKNKDHVDILSDNEAEKDLRVSAKDIEIK